MEAERKENGSTPRQPLLERSEYLVPERTLDSINTHDLLSAFFLSFGSGGLGAALSGYEHWHLLWILAFYGAAAFSIYHRQSALDDIKQESEVPTKVAAAPSSQTE